MPGNAAQATRLQFPKMRTALTIAVHLGGEVTELLAGFETPIDQQRATFKQLRQIETHSVFERVEFWESGSGRVLKHGFKHVQATPEAPIPAPASALMAAVGAIFKPSNESVAAMTGGQPETAESPADPEDDDHPAESNGFDATPRKRGRPPKSITG